MKIAVLAVQGAFIEHEKKLEKLGAQCIELRKKENLEEDFDGLVLPGGESTVQGKLLKELGMFDALKEKIEAGMPVFCYTSCFRKKKCLWKTAWQLSHNRRI